MRRALIGLITIGCLLVIKPPTARAEIRVAVASNFAGAANELADAFAQRSNTRPVLLFGSTGKHTAQILHGLSVDILLAADDQRPKRLEGEGLIIANTRATYAIGRLAIWAMPKQSTPKERKTELKIPDKLIQLLEGSERIAMANPRLAPYGAAAQQVIQRLGMSSALSRKIVMGENITQTYQFVRTQNADLGFIAGSQAISLPAHDVWPVPDGMYDSILQQMVLLTDSKEARQFYDFLTSDVGVAIIQKHGYDAPYD